MPISADVQKRGALAIMEEPLPRHYFLVGVLDTVQDVGYTLQMQRHIFSLTDTESARADLKSDDAADLRQARMFVGYFVDAQLLCMRKLVEVFVDVICFAGTNEHAYYRRYMLAKALDQAERLRRDWHTFFECDNSMMASVVSGLRVALDAQSECRDEACWFAGRNGKPTSVSARFRMAMSHATPEERISLGFSYNASYGFASRAAHIAIGTAGLAEVDFDTIDGYQRIVERLQLQILQHVIELAELERSDDDHRDLIGIVLSLPRYSTKGNHPEFATSVSVGDLVVTPQYPGVISETRASRYGNIACLVQPLIDEAVAHDASDWWPSLHLRPWMSSLEVLEECRAISPDIPEAPSNQQRVRLGFLYGRAILEAKLRETGT